METLEEYLDFAKDIAKYAGKVMMKYFKQNNGASYKGDKTIVTLADTEINSYLIKRVKESYPSHSVDGEEEHEVAMSGYYADIYNDKGIIEIQTRQLNKLRDKLSVFLQDYHVTVVYPLPFNKWLSWVNPDNGEVQGRRKSPRHFTEYDAFYELYKIKSYLKNPNLSINLVLMDMEEYKLLNGWSYDKKRGSTRYDRVPAGIRRIVKFDRIEDYMQLVPADLKEDFTVKDFAMAAGVSVEASRYTLNILNYLEIVKRTGRVKNGYVYNVTEEF